LENKLGCSPWQIAFTSDIKILTFVFPKNTIIDFGPQQPTTNAKLASIFSKVHVVSYLHPEDIESTVDYLSEGGNPRA